MSDRRRFDPLHLIAYVLLAIAITLSQADTNREAERGCENTNSLRRELNFVLAVQLSAAEREALRRAAAKQGIRLFEERKC